MKLKGIDQSRAQLKPFLLALLNSRGHDVNTKGFFRCPAHEETEGSAHFVPGSDQTKWKCMACSEGGDFFDALHFTDGLPRNGAGWIKETLPKACAEFGVELLTEDRELSAEEQKELDLVQAYEKASRILMSSQPSEAVQAKLTDYGWSQRTIRTFGIGGVSSTEKYLKALVKQGYTREWLTDVGLADGRIFRPECLIFTMKDKWGRPVGFSARYLGYENQEKVLKAIKEEHGADSAEFKAAAKKAQPKYVNTSTTAIYKKQTNLFGMHAAKNTSKSLYIFEGNADLVSAFNRGLINSVAVCGNNFNDQHFAQAIEAGFVHFIFVMDGDTGGQEATSRAAHLCETYLADKLAIRADIVDLPAEDGKMDPDLFLRTFGLAKFRKLPRRSYQYWLWSERLAVSDNLTVAGEAAAQIVQQPNPLFRYDMLVNLHQLTTVPMEILWDTVVRMAEQVDSKIAKDIVTSVSWMTFMRENSKQARRAIEQACVEEIHGVETCGSSLVASELASLAPAPIKAVAELVNEEKTAAAAAVWQ